MRRESCSGCGLRRTLLRIGPPGARHYVCGECWHTIGRWACERQDGSVTPEDLAAMAEGLTPWRRRSGEFCEHDVLDLVADHCGCLRCGECEQLREQCEECRPF